MKPFRYTANNFCSQNYIPECDHINGCDGKVNSLTANALLEAYEKNCERVMIDEDSDIWLPHDSQYTGKRVEALLWNVQPVGEGEK